MDIEDIIEPDSNDELVCLVDSSNEKDVDEALMLSGPFGRFQILVQIFFMYAVLTIGYQSVTPYFTGDNPPWTCVHNNSSTFCIENFGKEISVSNSNFSVRCHLNRNEWMYTKPKSYSYITEFDLVCKKSSVAALIGTGFFIGSAVGGIISGILADIYGRKVIFGISLFLVLSGSITCSFVKEIWQIILLRSVIGAGQGSGGGLSFIYLGEFIPTSYRSFSSNIYQVSLSLSSFFIVTVGYFVRNWRDLQLYVSFPPILAWIVLFLLPRSPRWLLATGKRSKAEDVVRNISKLNGMPNVNLKLKGGVSDNLSIKGKKYTYIDLFRKCEIILLVLAQCVIWFAGDLLFFGVTFSASDLGGNMYENFIFIALPDFPCCFIAMYLCNRFGRKKTVLISYFLSGIFIGAIAIFMQNLKYGYIIRVILAITGKCFSNFGSNGLYIWTFELFPTVVRSQGFCICLVASHIGGAVAPFLTNVLQVINPILPYLVMGVMGVLSSFVGLILPETKNSPSREQYDDIFVQKQNYKHATKYA